MVHVDSVSLDGVEVPQFVLELFVEKYLKPKYPNIGMDSRFALPARVDAATSGCIKSLLPRSNPAVGLRSRLIRETSDVWRYSASIRLALDAPQAQQPN